MAKYLDSTGIKAIAAINISANDTNVPVVLNFNFGTAFRVDGLDIVITTEAGVLIPRTVSPAGDGTFAIYYRDPAQTIAGGGTQLLCHWGGASVNVVNDLTTWQNCHGGLDDYILVAHGEETAANLTDESGNYAAADANITYAQPGAILKAPSFNGNNSVADWGDVTELNSTGEFTISCWMSMVDITALKSGLVKYVGGDDLLHLGYISGSKMHFYLGTNTTYTKVDNLGNFMANNTFAHVTFVFNGSLIGSEARAKIYINAVNRTSSSVGVVPATTTATAAAPLCFGFNANSFDGLLDDVRVFTGALSTNQIENQYDNQVGFATNNGINITNVPNTGRPNKSTLNMGILMGM